MKITYLSADKLQEKYGSGVLGYTDMEEGKVYIQKGLDKHTEKMVTAHERGHYDKKESGAFKLRSLIGPVVAAAGVATGNPALVAAGISIYQADRASASAEKEADAINAAAGSATSAQERSAAAAIAEQRRQFDLARSDTQPARDANNRTLSQLERMFLSPPSKKERLAEMTQRGFRTQPNNQLPNDVSQIQPRDYPGGGKAFRIGAGNTRLTMGAADQPDLSALYNQARPSPGGITNNQYGYIKSAPAYEDSAAGSQAPTQGTTYDQNGAVVPDYAPSEFDPIPGDTQPTQGSLEEGFTASPGYGFRVSEGEKGIDRYLAKTGMSLSGRGIKEAMRFNQDTASDEFGNYFNRNLASRQQGQSELTNYFSRRLATRQNREQERQNYSSRLFQLAGLGATGVQTGVNAGTNAANNISQANLSTGSNLANIYQSQGNNLADIAARRGENRNNAITSGIQNIASYYYGRR